MGSRLCRECWFAQFRFELFFRCGIPSTFLRIGDGTGASLWNDVSSKLNWVVVSDSASGSFKFKKATNDFLHPALRFMTVFLPVFFGIIVVSRVSGVQSKRWYQFTWQSICEMKSLSIFISSRTKWWDAIAMNDKNGQFYLNFVFQVATFEEIIHSWNTCLRRFECTNDGETRFIILQKTVAFQMHRIFYDDCQYEFFFLIIRKPNSRSTQLFHSAIFFWFQYNRPTMLNILANICIINWRKRPTNTRHIHKLRTTL